MSNSSEDLGDMGEAAFMHWCSSAGLICNKSEKDRKGWDFYVEFPNSENQDSDTIDEPSFNCKVQVKSTNAEKRTLQITLQNLYNLCIAPLPTFYLFIEYNNKNTPQAAFLVHVDNDLITKTLKKIYESKQNNEENKLNKKTMGIHYNEDHKFDIPNETTNFLKETFLKYTGNNISEYINKKMAHLKSTGFDEAGIKIAFDIEGEDNIKKLIDMSVGIKQSIDVKSFKLQKYRFEIPNKSASLHSENAKIEVSPKAPNTIGSITFKESKLLPGISFKSELYVSLPVPIPNNLENLYKVRIKNQFIDLQMMCYGEKISNPELSILLEDNTQVEFNDLKKILQVYSLITSSKRYYIELDFEDDFSLTLDTKISSQEFPFNLELITLEKTTKILNYFDIPVNTVCISLTELQKEQEGIFKMVNFLNVSTETFTFLLPDNSIFNYENKQYACFYPVNIKIGNYICGFLIVIAGYIKEVCEKKLQFIPQEKFIRDKFAQKSNKIDFKALNIGLEKIKEEYRKNYLLLDDFIKK